MNKTAHQAAAQAHETLTAKIAGALARGVPVLLCAPPGSGARTAAMKAIGGTVRCIDCAQLDILELPAFRVRRSPLVLDGADQAPENLLEEIQYLLDTNTYSTVAIVRDKSYAKILFPKGSPYSIVEAQKCADRLSDRVPKAGGDEMTKREAIAEFREFVLPNIPKNDKPTRDQAWNDYTDGLCKDKRITQKQYDTWVHPF